MVFARQGAEVLHLPAKKMRTAESDDPKNLKITSKDQETLTFHKQRQDLFIWQEPVDADTKQRPENTF